MRITATVANSASSHEVIVATDGTSKPLAVRPKPGGRGSAINGGEFLMLALATCYCNDLYREAERRNLEIASVEVEASADFEGVGLAATNIRYRARVTSAAGEAAVAALLRDTDAVAEVQNTIRSGVQVERVAWEEA